MIASADNEVAPVELPAIPLSAGPTPRPAPKSTLKIISEKLLTLSREVAQQDLAARESVRESARESTRESSEDGLVELIKAAKVNNPDGPVNAWKKQKNVFLDLTVDTDVGHLAARLGVPKKGLVREFIKLGIARVQAALESAS